MDPSGNGKGIPLMCSCCNLPFAYLRNGVLVVQSRHHGQSHQNVVAVSELSRILTVSVVVPALSPLPGGLAISGNLTGPDG